jgi:hypothetical protein
MARDPEIRRNIEREVRLARRQWMSTPGHDLHVAVSGRAHRWAAFPGVGSARSGHRRFHGLEKRMFKK